MYYCKPGFDKLLSFLLLTTILLGISCGRKQQLVSIDPEISKYISSFTSGVISKTASIKIQLASNASTTHPLGETNQKLFDFSPSVKGKTIWIDARTIEFKPDKPLKPGTLYTIRFLLNKVMDVPDKFHEFVFNAEILRPSFVVKEGGLRSNDDNSTMFLPGTIETSDFEDLKDIEKILTASHGKDNLKIVWQHQDDSKIHHFTVEGINRTGINDSLTLKWNGTPLESKNSGTKLIMVPAKNNFTVLDVRAINDDGQYISVLFSDPININKELNGLITVSNQEQVVYSINGSEVKVYLSDHPEGDYTVNINTGIENRNGKTLEQGFVSNISFESQKPSVEIVGKGNILPHEGRLTLPFTAINLNAVDISIIKIYENNIPQFLQTNDMGGNSNLRQVAVPIVQQTIRLDDDKSLNLHKRQRFSLDLDKYLNAEPGAIYNVTIGFRPSYSLYDCGNSGIENTDETNEEDWEESEEYYDTGGNSPDDYDDFWNRYDDYYPFGYNWKFRDNPCHKSYYNKDRFASRNIFASNIGIIAHRGANNQLTVIVTDILTAKPVVGAEVKVLDYQQQVAGSTKADEFGIATLETSRKPYLIVVSTVYEKGYLKIDDGSNLPLSRFDIAGEEVKNGIKGFIFGERGVWRPGDSLYISFIEQDLGAKLPEDHPIEFELHNPMGQLYKKLVQQNTSGGFNVFKTATDAGAPTGNWRAKIKVGGATFEKNIRIETVMPNRLKIDLNFGTDTILGKNRNNKGILTSSWLFGAPSRNLKATIDLSLSSLKNPFPKYKGFTFDNPTAVNETKTITIYKGTLNNDGVADVQTNIQNTENAPGMMKANMLIKVFEPGGAFSTKTMSLPYSPFSSYTGIQIPEGKKPWDFITTGTTHTVKIVNIDANGTLLPGKRNLEISFYKVQWRWWWDKTGDEFSNFTQDKYNKLIKNETVYAENGRADWNFNIPENAWGRYLILVKDVQSGHTSGAVMYIDNPGWQSRNNFDDPTAASMLSFTSDKEKYNVGDNITLTIPGSNEGKGLITISSGSKVLKTWWVDTRAGQTQITFQAEKNWAPNVYASVSLLQPYNQTINDLPIRMYGVIPIIIDNPATNLTPVIEMPSVIRPEQKTTITISEKKNREMWYSIAIVDEGLLDLTNFKTPNPHDYFYAREALSVKSWDLYDYVIGAWGNNIERILTIGGDQEGKGPVQQKAANRFPPVVKFLGPFKLSRGKQTQSFTLPEYSGSVRVMVVAAGNAAYGSTQKTVQVKKPLMMLATLPKVLSPGEKISLPVTVFATENNIKTANIRLQTNNLFDIISSPVQQINFSQPGEQTISFDVKVKDYTGIGKVNLSAVSGNEKAGYQTEIGIRNANPFITRISSATISGNKSWTQKLLPIGEVSSSESVIEISSIPSINLQKHLDFLIEYPHGCVEQTTSRVFAQLYLNQLSDLNAVQKAQIEKNIRAGITSLQNFQVTDGGFAYWPGNRESDDWSTSYAGHFLLLAKDAGYFVPDQMLQQWKTYQKNKANLWAPSTTQFYGADLTQAYRLFTLALSKSPELGAMNRLKAFQYLSPEAKWRLAAAYQLAGYPNVANSLISGLSTGFGRRVSPGITFGSGLRDEAMVLETLTLMGKRNLAESVLNKMAAQLSEDYWYSTQTTAYALLSIAEFTGKNKSLNKISARIKINGKDTTITSSSYIVRINVPFVNGNGAVSVNNLAGNTLFVKSTTKGQPLTGEVVNLVNNPQLLRMSVSYLNRNKEPLDISNLMQGSDFIVRVSVTNPGNRADYNRMALTQIIPSGWEILNTRLFDAEGEFKSSPAQYMDIRDDRVYTYFDLKPNETKTFYLQVTAAYTGSFYLPAVFCNSMYDESIQASAEGRWIKVTSPSESVR